MNAHTLITHNGKVVETSPAESVARAEAEATNSAASRKLYTARVPVYPKEASGLFRNLKWAVMALTLSIYYLVPWIRWDRGPHAPHQAVLVDMNHERLYFFFIEIWPQEVYYITGLLILAAVTLFLTNSLFGRLWCGYSCPQTVWTDLFIWVETRIEGDRNARTRLAKAPWTTSKIAKRVGKHAVWLFIALATGGAWVFYFADAPTLLHLLFTGTASMGTYAMVAGLAFTTYTLGGLMREQVCTYMCPWPRIQAAMTDKDSLSVTYRRDRGETRGPHKKGDPWEGRGDCIDCKQCVAVCPMGIDIRDGAQLECINCGLCVDACNDVMERVGRPKWLIAYDTEANVLNRLNGKPARFRFIRPRTVLYGMVILLVSGIMLMSLMTRHTLDLGVMRDRNPDFVTLSDGAVRNGYTVSVMNRADQDRVLDLDVRGLKLRTVKIIGLGEVRLPAKIAVEGDRLRSLRVLLTVAKKDLKASDQPLIFILSDRGHSEIHQTSGVFISGGQP